MEKKNYLLSIVVPCYNEAKNINSTFNTLVTELKSLVPSYEIIFVDNGGTDNQLEIMKKLYNQNNDVVRIVSLSRNFGYQMSISAGLEFAKGDAIIIIDADLQDPVSLFGTFIKKWEEGFDVVYGIRNKRRGSFFMKPFYYFFYKLFHWTSDIEVPVNAGEFGLISRKVADKILEMPERVRFIRGLRAWVGFKQTGVPYVRDQRSKGKSKFRFFDTYSLALDGILSFSTRILTFLTLLGFLTLSFSLLLIGYILYWRYYHGELIPGYAALMVTVSFFSGIIIMMLGIIGAYIERIFLEVKERPRFIVEETLGFND